MIVGNPDKMDASKVFGAIFQYPGTYGHVRDFTDHIAKLHEHKAHRHRRRLTRWR